MSSTDMTTVPIEERYAREAASAKMVITNFRPAQIPGHFYKKTTKRGPFCFQISKQILLGGPGFFVPFEGYIISPPSKIAFLLIHNIIQMNILFLVLKENNTHCFVPQ